MFAQSAGSAFTAVMNGGASLRAILAVVALMVACGHAAAMLWATSFAPDKPVGSGTAHTALKPSVESRVLDSNDWLDSVRSGRIFRRKRGTSNSSRQPRINQGSRSSLGGITPKGNFLPWNNGSSDERGSSNQRRRRRMASVPYRTLCVRMCDGYYFPVSTSTRKYRFRKDAARCASQCGAPTRLFYYPVNGDPSQMKDLSGRPYIKLSTAFLYRTAYNSACKCQPHPWEAASKRRHELYALQAKRRTVLRSRKLRRDRRLRRQLVGEIRSLRRKIRDDKKLARRETRGLTKSVLKNASSDAQADRVDKYFVQTKQTPLSFVVPNADVQTKTTDQRRVTVSGSSAGEARSKPVSGRAEQPRRRARPERRRRYRPSMRLGAASKRQRSERRARRPRSVSRRRRNDWRRRAFNMDD